MVSPFFLTNSRARMVSALFLTIAMALPAAFSFDELVETKTRFDDTVYNNYGTGEDIIMDFYVCNNWAVNLLGAALIATAMLLIFESGSAQRFRGKQDPPCPEVMRATLVYFRWARWVLLWSFLTALGGIITTFMAFVRFVILKFPNYYLEKKEEDAFDKSAVFGYYMGMANSWLIIPTIVIWFFLGAGVSFAQRVAIRASANLRLPATPKLTSSQSKNKVGPIA